MVIQAGITTLQLYFQYWNESLSHYT